MILLIYIIATAVAVYYGWIDWQSNTIVSVVTFLGIYLIFLIINYTFFYINRPTKPSFPDEPIYDDSASSIGSILDIFGLSGIGTVVGGIIDQQDYNQKVDHYNYEITQRINSYNSSLTYTKQKLYLASTIGLIWTFGFIFYCYFY